MGSGFHYVLYPLSSKNEDFNFIGILKHQLKANEINNYELFSEKPFIEKERFVVLDRKLKWEIDVFVGDNEGLKLAEVELEDECQDVEIPEWIGEEVTFDNRYFNSSLVKLPFKNW